MQQIVHSLRLASGPGDHRARRRRGGRRAEHSPRGRRAAQRRPPGRRFMGLHRQVMSNVILGFHRNIREKRFCVPLTPLL